MKNSLLALLVTLTAGLLAGCGTLDLTPEGNPSRVVSGTVELVGLVAEIYYQNLTKDGAALRMGKFRRLREDKS